MSRIFRLPALCLAIFSLATAFTIPSGAETTGSKTARPIISGEISSSQLVRLPAPPITALKTAVDEGRVSSAHELDLSLTMKRSPEQQLALNAFIKQTRTPGSPNYGQTMTSDEFVETFGLAEHDITALQNWLEYEGFKITAVTPEQDLISFHGTAGQAEQAFGTEIHSYRSTDGRQFFANASDIRVPSTLAPAIARIDGLQNLHRDGILLAARPIFDGGASASVEPELSVGREELNHGWTTPLAANLSLTKMREGSRGVTADLFEITSTTVTIAPTTPLAFAGGATSVITAKVAYTGAGAPTGTLTLSDSAGSLNVSINLSSCTAAAGLDTCTYNWTAASGATVNSPDTITAAYGGDATFASSSGTASLALTYANGFFNANSESLTSSSYSFPQGSLTPVILTFKITGGFAGKPTGNVMIWGSGTIDQIKEFTSIQTGSVCATSGRSETCTISWDPSTLPAGTYTLEASYSGDGTYVPFNLVANAPFVVTASGTTATTTTLSVNPNTVYAGGGTTFTTVTTYSGAAPTGSIAITPNGSFQTIGGAVFPTGGATTSSGSGAYYFGQQSYNYNCTTNTSAKTVTCTITDSDAADFLPNQPGANTVTGAYSGDSTYKGSSGTATLTFTNGNTNASTTTVTASPSAVAYQAGTSVTYTATVNGSFFGPKPTGTVLFSGSVITGTTVTGTIVSTNCTEPLFNWVCTVTASAVVPVSVQPGTYTVTASYRGDSNYSGSSGTTTVSVTGNIATTSTVTASPLSVSPGVPSTTVTDVISWSPAQTISPTGTVKLTCGNPSAGTCGTLPAAKNLSSCTTLSSTSVSCSITYALDTDDTAYGNYTLVMTYSGDANYKASSGSVVVDDVQTGTRTSTTTVTANPTSVAYGAGTSVTYTADVVGSAGRGQPTGAVSFSGTPITGSPINGTIVNANCTRTGTTTANYIYTCPVTATAIVPVGTAVNTTGYTITATYNGDGTYLASQGTTTVKVTLATPTVAVSAVSGAYESTVTLTAIETGPANSANPSGNPTFTVNGVTVPGTANCFNSGTTGNAQTCTINYTLPASLVANNYTIGVSFAADSNYAAASGTGTLTVTTDTTATTVTANPTTIARNGASTLTATVSNSSVPGVVPTGTVAFSFSGGSLGSCTLSGGTCTASVNGTSLAGGANTITATYSGVTNEFASSSNTTTVTLTCTGLCFSSVTHNLGSVPQGQSTTGTSNYGVQVTNNGTTAYTNLKVSLGGNSPGSFSDTTNCPVSLAVGAKCEIIFTFTPQAVGQVTATWSVSGTSGFTYDPSNGGTLTGTGTPAGGVTLSTGGHNFGAVTDGTTSPVYGTVLTNSTASAVTLSFTTVTAPFNVTLNNCPASLAANQSCNLQFDFSPTGTGLTSQTFGISVNGGSTPITTGGVTVTGVKLTGTGQ